MVVGVIFNLFSFHPPCSGTAGCAAWYVQGLTSLSLLLPFVVLVCLYCYCHRGSGITATLFLLSLMVDGAVAN